MWGQTLNVSISVSESNGLSFRKNLSDCLQEVLLGHGGAQRLQADHIRAHTHLNKCTANSTFSQGTFKASSKNPSIHCSPFISFLNYLQFTAHASLIGSPNTQKMALVKS